MVSLVPLRCSIFNYELPILLLLSEVENLTMKLVAGILLLKILMSFFSLLWINEKEFFNH